MSNDSHFRDRFPRIRDMPANSARDEAKISSTAPTSPSKSRDVLNTLYEISLLLDTGLDRTSFELCTKLCELGVAPDLLATTVAQLYETATSRSNHR
ncbi:uncharacterized protein V1518DRAFT_409175 [Limtongia smithiae]|uniref:uncharacterized protein n=1 Tax=Limtongia smithiae TaxID=1125753 RepID=UPI0034CF576E